MDVTEDWYKEAFVILSRGRSNSIVETPISIKDMVFYLEYFGSPFPVDISCSIISRIDIRLQEHIQKKRNAQNKKDSKVSK